MPQQLSQFASWLFVIVIVGIFELLWNWLLLSDNVKRARGVSVAFWNVTSYQVFSIPVLYKGSTLWSVLVQCQGFVKEWTFWSEKLNKSSLYFKHRRLQNSGYNKFLSLPGLWIRIFIFFSLHFYCQNIVLRLFSLHAIIGREVCMLSLFCACNMYIVLV